MFIRAIDYLRLNLENKARVYLPAPCDETSDEDEKVQRRLRFDQEKAQVARRTALCLALGLGWISYTQGLLRHALPFVLTAQTLLCATNDWINKAYVELLYGSIQRSMAGYDVAKLAEAIQILLRPYGIFERHLPYRSRAAWELALASLYSSKYLEAENYLEEVRRIAEDAEDERWQCNAMILESRIHRRKRDPLKAANVASDALRKAHDAGQVLCEIDALITRGEARLDLGDYRDARSDFTDALKQGNSNAQTQAVCHLHLADTALKENNIRLAEEHYSEWQKVEHYVENAIVQALAENVGSAIAQQRSDFVIPWTSDDLNFEHHVDLLWEFLLKQARRKHTSKDQIARVLGVSRQTLYKRSLSSRE
jgi:tetratricopeptide (TPR) repeat protein